MRTYNIRMAKRGPKPKELVKIKWSSNFSYAMGLIATDGCLSKDGLLIDLTSKDREQLLNYMRCLKIKIKIGKKHSSAGNEYLRIQFKNRLFYNFLISIGFTTAKSKTIKKIDIPSEYFFDFLRGCFDGDGYTYSYWDPRWKSSFMFYMGYVSASKDFLIWLQKEIQRKSNIKGKIYKVITKNKNTYYQLKYAKKEASILVKCLYNKRNSVYLKRKKLKIDRALAIVEKQLNAQVS